MSQCQRIAPCYAVLNFDGLRFKSSAIPFMTKMLNDYQIKEKVTFAKLDAIPVNYVCNKSHHCVNNDNNNN